MMNLVYNTELDYIDSSKQKMSLEIPSYQSIAKLLPAPFPQLSVMTNTPTGINDLPVSSEGAPTPPPLLGLKRNCHEISSSNLVAMNSMKYEGEIKKAFYMEANKLKHDYMNALLLLQDKFGLTDVDMKDYYVGNSRHLNEEEDTLIAIGALSSLSSSNYLNEQQYSFANMPLTVSSEKVYKEPKERASIKKSSGALLLPSVITIAIEESAANPCQDPMQYQAKLMDTNATINLSSSIQDLLVQHVQLDSQKLLLLEDVTKAVRSNFHTSMSNIFSLKCLISGGNTKYAPCVVNSVIRRVAFALRDLRDKAFSTLAVDETTFYTHNHVQFDRLFNSCMIVLQNLVHIWDWNRNPMNRKLDPLSVNDILNMFVDGTVHYHLLRKEDTRRTIAICLVILLIDAITPWKYRTVMDLLAVYPEFNTRNETDKMLLLQNANLFSCALTFIGARSNKGILIGLIPKLVEGPHVKYITGGGASKPTIDRVLIFEREGNIHAKKREGRAVYSSSKLMSMLDNSSVHSSTSRHSDLNYDTDE